MGFGLFSGLATALLVGLNDCSGDDWCVFSGLWAASVSGAFVAALPLLVGVPLGTLGTVRRRRATRRGTWSFALQGAGGRVGLVF
ncbi:MAG: hypothetical protein H6720_12700 [Sandaracinus sp.]|nr:hypothetical protein [Sandaracinus sp.]